MADRGSGEQLSYVERIDMTKKLAVRSSKDGTVRWTLPLACVALGGVAAMTQTRALMKRGATPGRGPAVTCG